MKQKKLSFAIALCATFFVSSLLQVLPFGKDLGWASCSAQPSLILNNDIYIGIRNNAYLIINNSAANAITTLGSGGNYIRKRI